MRDRFSHRRFVIGSNSKNGGRFYHRMGLAGLVSTIWTPMVGLTGEAEPAGARTAALHGSGATCQKCEQ